MDHCSTVSSSSSSTCFVRGCGSPALPREPPRAACFGGGARSIATRIPSRVYRGARETAMRTSRRWISRFGGVPRGGYRAPRAEEAPPARRASPPKPFSWFSSRPTSRGPAARRVSSLAASTRLHPGRTGEHASRRACRAPSERQGGGSRSISCRGPCKDVRGDLVSASARCYDTRLPRAARRWHAWFWVECGGALSVEGRFRQRTPDFSSSCPVP